jgi:tRNA(adenine34) deaminase
MNNVLQSDETFMWQAIGLAEQADKADEVPVGAIVVRDGYVMGSGHNMPISQCDPTAHAEIIALRQAAIRLHNYRLNDCILYVTLEPCPMCAGAIIHSRIARLVFGASDPKNGACGSVINLLADTRLNHHTEVFPGILAQQCSELLSHFFARHRKK